jgi:hypothetical protein
MVLAFCTAWRIHGPARWNVCGWRGSGNTYVTIEQRYGERGDDEMESVGLFLAGFTAGWVVRSTVDSSRKLAVTAIALAHEVTERTRRWVAVEREYFEDLFAEGRAQYEAQRARATERKRPVAARPEAAPQAANGAGRERAA